MLSKSNTVSISLFGALGLSLALSASGHEIEDRTLDLSDENYLCTLEGTHDIDTGKKGTVTVKDGGMWMLVGKATRIFVVDNEANELRVYSPYSRRLSRHNDQIRNGGTIVIAGHSFSDGPGGYTVLIDRDDLHYHTRQDFGGRTGTFKTSERFGSCKLFETVDELPETRASELGLTGAEAEAYYDQEEAEIEQSADRIMEEFLQTRAEATAADKNEAED